MCMFCFSPSRIQIGKMFDAKQTIYVKWPNEKSCLIYHIDTWKGIQMCINCLSSETHVAKLGEITGKTRVLYWALATKVRIYL